ncbi:MAG: hypothetical protein E6I91_09200 [Chloroflexi bacterium]|nr:MAG: hypothetical protein E6I91_09200 [Chloroflexota bacterium]
MSKPSGRLVLASVCCLLSANVGTWLAIRQHLPAQFGGLMHGEDVVKDFFWRGTALSAPFPLLLGQFVLTGCLVRGGQIGRVGVRGLTVLGGCYTLGQLGEPIVGRVFKVGAFEPAQALLVVTNMLCSLLMMVFGIRAWNVGRE